MKQFDTTSLRRGVTFSIFLAMFLLLIIIAAATALTQKYALEKREQEYIEQVHHSVEHAVEQYLKIYTYRVRRIIETTIVSQMLQQQDREGLYRFFKPKWDLMREEEPALAIMTFHLSDGTSFLRMSRPEHFGDQLTPLRPMVKEVHRSHQQVSGYETCKMGVLYRIVAPIFDAENRYMGALEVGLNPHFLLRAIHNIHGFDGLIFIKESDPKRLGASNDPLIDGYRLQLDLSPELEDIYGELASVDRLKDDMEITIDDKLYLVHLFAFNDFQNEPKVKIVVFHDISEIGLHKEYLFVWLLISMVIILSLLIWFVYRRIGTYQDAVTQVYRKQMEQLDESEKRLQFSRNYLQSIFDFTPHIMITTDGHTIENATPVMLEFFGYETLDALKKEHDSICDFFLEDGKDKKCLKRVMQGVSWLEYILSRPDKVHKVCMMHKGKRHRFIVRAKPLGVDEKHRSVVTFIDITELEETRERLEYAVNGSNDGLWDWDIESNAVYYSPRWKAILGYKDEELPNLFGTWKDRIHPDDIEKALHDVEMSHRSPGIPFENIHRLRHKDGHWVWILGRGKTVFNENGKAVRMVGFQTDISESKEKETKIEKLSTLLTNILNSVDNLIFVKDKEGNFVECNPAVTKLIGISKEEIIGKSDYDFFDKETADFFRNKDKKMLAKGQTVSNFEWVTYPDGKEVYLLTVKAPLRDSDGTIVGLVGNSVDVTELKQLEDELRASKQQFDLFMLHMPYLVNIKDEFYRSIYANPATDTFLNKPVAGTTAIENAGEKVGKQVNLLCDRAKAQGKAEELIKFEKNGQSYVLRILAFAIPQNDGKVYVGMITIDITEQYRDQHEVAKFKQVLENSPVSIVITDIDGNIEYVNPWFCQLTGYSQEEVIGQNPRILQSGYTNEDEYRALWNEISHGHVWSGIFKNLKKNGEAYWESVIISPVKKETGEIVNYISVKQEITEQIHMEQELMKQGEKTRELGTILEESLNEIYIFDRNSLKFLYANKGAQNNIGYSPEELFEMTPLDIKPQITAEKFSELVKPLDRDKVEKVFFSTLHRRKDGTTYPVDVYLQQIVFEGTDAYMAIIIDTTEYEKIREELRDKEELMIAQSRHAAMGEMIGMIAHQWRQPITVIAMGANNMLVDMELDEVKPEVFKKYAHNILHQVEYLSKTIDDFRNFFRPDKEREKVKVEEVFLEAEKIIGKTLEQNDVTLSISGQSTQPVRTYSRELLQVFINLLKNAKEALVENRPKDRRIEVVIREDEESLITTICDNGGGIDDAIIEKIFDPYFSTKDEKTGTGLGLYMSKTIVEKHLHGPIEVGNTKEGVCFKIAIPLVEDSK
ncbi:MAG: PAS domain S-box protein [Sulfurimonadaceae bacterium]